MSDVDFVKSEIETYYQDTYQEVEDVYARMSDVYDDIEDEVHAQWDEFLGEGSQGDDALGYASIAGKVFASVALIASLMSFLGLLLGFLGGFCDGSRVAPGGRVIKAPSGMSKHGGNCLMASVGCAFFFGTFMWIITAIFIVIALGGSAMCETWVKPDRPIVSGILDRTDGDFYNALGKMVFGDETSRTYLFESFFNDCAIGIPPYVSMSLEDEFEIARKLVRCF